MRYDRVRRAPVAATALLRTLTASAHAAGCGGDIVPLSEQPWASATFVGSRHVLCYTAPSSPSRAEWLATLKHAQFVLPGHVLADLTVESQTRDRVLLAALTLDAS